MFIGVKMLKTDYELLQKQFTALVENETDFIAICAQLTALLFAELNEVNWVGFYYLKENELILGPFQGKVACMRIPMGRGVCGAVAKTKAALIIDDVHRFADHIVCDSASNSEIVLPLMKNNELMGVLDIDSPKLNRFTTDDLLGLQKILRVITI